MLLDTKNTLPSHNIHTNSSNCTSIKMKQSNYYCVLFEDGNELEKEEEIEVEPPTMNKPLKGVLFFEDDEKEEIEVESPTMSKPLKGEATSATAAGDADADAKREKKKLKNAKKKAKRKEKKVANRANMVLLQGKANRANVLPQEKKAKTTTAPFKKYSSIENSYREKYVSKCFDAISNGWCVDDFVVEEKAHGANFSFYYDGLELKTASRSMFLENHGESFSNSHLIKAKYAEKIFELYSLLGSVKPIRVVGELIGGSYQHPDVADEPGLPRIQKGVQYCPFHEFYAFDLSFLADDSTEAVYTTMDRLEANRLFEQVDMFYAKPLYRGTLEDCLKYDNTFKSHIPDWLGLPEHPGKNKNLNLAEGKVIKPVQFARLGNGDRIILKDKTESFEEVAFGRAPKGAKKAKPPAPPNLSSDGTELCQKLLAHVTENRFHNVLSKLPNVCTSKDCGYVCGLFSQDTMEDFRKDFGESFDALEPKEQKVLRKRLATEAITLVRANLSK